MNFKFEYMLSDSDISVDFLNYLLKYLGNMENKLKNLNWILCVGNFKLLLKPTKSFIFDESLNNSNQILVISDNIQDLNVLYESIINYFMKEK